MKRSRFQGTCYRAASWQRLGETCGRARNDRDISIRVKIKAVFLHPLTPPAPPGTLLGMTREEAQAIYRAGEETVVRVLVELSTRVDQLTADFALSKPAPKSLRPPSQRPTGSQPRHTRCVRLKNRPHSHPPHRASPSPRPARAKPPSGPKRRGRPKQTKAPISSTASATTPRASSRSCTTSPPPPAQKSHAIAHSRLAE